ncbi:MAG: efflux RND transporter periplasmic adaptor subunit [Pseudomonadota bacterium]
MDYESAQQGSEARALPGWRDERGSRRWWIIGGLVVAVLAIAAFLMSRGGDDADKKTPAPQLANVSVVVPGRTQAARTLSATGTLAARRELPVGVAGEGGMVTRVLVEPGQWVGAGQVLASIDRSVQTQTAASLSAQINVARADAALAQSELDRAQTLVGRGFISKADLERRTATRDAANARVRVAQAQLGEARARTGRLDIRAPAAGLVLTRAVEPGQVISSGSGVLFRMAKGGELEMRAQLSEADLAGLNVGARASVTPVGGTQAFTGQVWQVSPVIDPQSRQGIARIALSYNSALRPGGFATATLVGGTSQLPQLPQSAIQSDEQGNFVYIVDAKDMAQKRRVTLGPIGDKDVAIATGLDGSERVVVSAGAFLNVGQKIKPVLQKNQG